MPTLPKPPIRAQLTGGVNSDVTLGKARPHVQWLPDMPTDLSAPLESSFQGITLTVLKNTPLLSPFSTPALQPEDTALPVYLHT